MVELTALRPGELCYSLACRRAGVTASTTVAFGALRVWPDVAGRSYPMCFSCWRDMLDFLGAHEPGGITVRSVRS